jgi:hypothetical protein
MNSGAERQASFIPNPIEIASDIQSVSSNTILGLSKYRSIKEGVSGVPLRFIEIISKSGSLMSATIGLSDVAFLAETFAKILEDDLVSLKQLNGFKLIGQPTELEKYSKHIDDSIAHLTACREALRGLEIFTPPDEPGELEKPEAPIE